VSNANGAPVLQDKRAETADIPSRAVRVTLFEDRAEVVRQAAMRVEAGARWVSIGGVSLVVDDGTVQAKVVSGAARVLSARVLRRAGIERALGQEEIERLEEATREAQDRAATALGVIERQQRHEQRLFKLTEQWVSAAALGPKNATDPAVLASYRDALGAIDASVTATLAEIARARAEHARAEDERNRAEERLREGRQHKPRLEAAIEIELEATEEGDVEVKLVYRLPCALWRPEHLARLADGASAEGASAAGEVEIVTYATAWQRTGERWEDVTLRFSTARPARAASAPELRDDVLFARRKTDEERRQIVIGAREQAVQFAGLERGERAVDEMPGVDDGGEPVLYEGKERVTLLSNGRPFRVEIGRASVKAELARVILGQRAPVAHLRATATLEGAGPLLAGPVRLAHGASMVGRARLDFVGKGEPFELGFGPDDAIRVRRTEEEERDTAAITGAQRIKRKVTLYLSNLSGSARRASITERIPVSEIEDVEIALLDAGPFAHDGKDGFLKVDVDIGPQATKTISYSYELRAGSRVALPAF
jgi:uncharacterized protein (TIGR02231 family)